MKNTKNVVYAGVIACIYAVLTLVPGLNSMAYGPIQLRLSEILTILPLFTKSAVPGLAIGCVLSNLGSPMMAVDVVFGAAATLVSAFLTYILRKNKKTALLMPPLFNGIIVGAELSIFYADAAKIMFLYNMLSVFLSEFIVCFVIGYPLSVAIEKKSAFKKW